MDEELDVLPSDLQGVEDSYDWGTDTDYQEAYGGDGGPDPSDYGADWDTGEPIDETEGLTQEQLGQGIVQESLGRQITEQASADFAAGGSGYSGLQSWLNFGQPLTRLSSQALSLLGPSEARAMETAAPILRYAAGLGASAGTGIVAGGTRAVRSVGAFVLKNLRTRFPGLSISRIRSSVRTFGPVAVASVLGLTVEGLVQMLMTNKPRRMNVMNQKALTRATRRMAGFHKKSVKIHALMASIIGRSGFRRPASRFPFKRKRPCR